MQKIIDGKVRQVFDVGDDKLVIMTSDNISAFDVVLPNKVDGKGEILNKISLFWFNFTKDIIANHILDDKLLPKEFENKNAIVVKKLNMLPFEFVVRGFMFGNMYKAYKNNGEFCGIKFDKQYDLGEKLNAPMITISTKTVKGDEYISEAQVLKNINKNLLNHIKNICLKLYNVCYNYALTKRLIIADTKFEFGLDKDGNLVLADEIFTPDSSRYWDKIGYKKSFDKQILRDWLLSNNMDFDNVPKDILDKIKNVYAECLNRLTKE
ncbi:MAG: phosphoribosylaminoimidazolesuccinocarboxamide synthase [Firmicutes bacterium]|nr:phosphoribosylaminoimidazolesuccinocarboxamide synthase [Bacillota bacterium]